MGKGGKNKEGGRARQKESKFKVKEYEMNLEALEDLAGDFECEVCELDEMG